MAKPATGLVKGCSCCPRVTVLSGLARAYTLGEEVNLRDEHAWIDRQEYPFRSNYLPLEMGRLHYVDEGRGDPIVMVHGNPAWSFLYRHFVTVLSADHRCVALDHIGFGLSDKPHEWSYRPAGHARNLQALIEDLGLQDVTLVVRLGQAFTGVFNETPAYFVALLVIPLLTAILTIGLLVFTVLVWKDRYWSVVGRVHYSLITLAALAFTWFVNYWNLLGFRF